MTSINRKRLAFAAAYLALLALTYAVQRHLRPEARATGMDDLGILDWAPSFLVAFASPFLFALLDPRLNRFAVWCAWLLVAQLLHEYEQQFSAGHRYDPRDMAAIVAGFALSYLLHRWFARGGRSSIPAGRYTLDLDPGRSGTG